MKTTEGRLIDVDQVIQAYRTGSPINDIQAFWRAPREDIKHLLEAAGVKIGRPNNRRTLTIAQRTRLREIVDGLMLGDGCIERNSLRVVQSANKVIDRRQWLELIQQQLHEIGIESVIEEYRAYSGKQSYVTKNGTRRWWQPPGEIRVRTLSYDVIGEERLRWYPDGRKQLPSDLYLTRIGLTHWFAGDGNGALWDARFATNGFTRIEVIRLVLKLRNDFDIEAKIRSHIHPSGKVGTIIAVSRRGSQALKRLIEDQLPACFRYKLDMVPDDDYGLGQLGKRLQPDDVRAIRASLRLGKHPIALGKQFKVSSYAIEQIRRRATWASL